MALAHQLKRLDGRSSSLADVGVGHLLLEAGPAEFVTTPDGASSIFYQVNEQRWVFTAGGFRKRHS